MVGMVELEEVKALAFLEERQQQNNLCCPVVLLGRGCHCSSIHFHCHQQHSSQERPMKIQPHGWDHHHALMLTLIVKL